MTNYIQLTLEFYDTKEYETEMKKFKANIMRKNKVNEFYSEVVNKTINLKSGVRKLNKVKKMFKDFIYPNEQFSKLLNAIDEYDCFYFTPELKNIKIINKNIFLYMIPITSPKFNFENKKRAHILKIDTEGNVIRKEIKNKIKNKIIQKVA